MIVKQIKLSSQAKEKLSRLKGKTGIKNWNILCRWALCYSLHENTIPTDIPINSDSNVEMSWYTFAGEFNELYEAIVVEWCKGKGIDPTDENVAKYFKLDSNMLKGKMKKKNVTDARAIAMYLSRIMTDESLERIGLEFGGRDHSTVIYSHDKISKELINNLKLQEEIKLLKDKICEQ